jgi:HEAT repeat protein
MTESRLRLMPALCSLALLSTCLSVPLAAGELSRERVFTRTSGFSGTSYKIGRRLLESQGKAILPFLREKVRSKDWRQRDLAGALILRIEKPAQAALWRRTLSGWNHTFTYRDDGTILVKFDPREAQYAKRTGKAAPSAASVVLTKEVVPLVLDFMREVSGDISRGSGPTGSWQRGLAALKHFAAPQSAPALLHWYTGNWRSGPAIVEALVRIGKPAVPMLREMVRNCPTEWPDSDTDAHRRIRETNAGPMRTAGGAARALGRINDRRSVRMLVAKLEKATYAEQVEAFCEALGEIAEPSGAAVVFAQLLRTVGIQRKSRGGHSSDDPEYHNVRRAMATFGKSAEKFLRKRAGKRRPLAERAIAAGLLFEIQHPGKVAKFYDAFGRMLLVQRRARRGHPHKDDAADPRLLGRADFWGRYSFLREDTLGKLTVPPELLAERAYVFSDIADLQEVAVTDKDLRFDLLADALKLPGGRRGGGQARLARLLAATGDQRAVEVYARFLEKEYPPCSVIEAMLLLGSARAVPSLEKLVRRAAAEKRRNRYLEEAAGLAAAVLPVLKGEAKHLVKLLDHEKPSVRECAARCLARKGDLRALPVLVKAAAAAAAHGRQRQKHLELREALLRLGQAAVEPLGKLGAAATEWREKLLCEALALRLAKPELAAAFEKAGRVRDRGFMMHGGPSVGTYQAAGKRVAKATGKQAVPLLEVAVAAGADCVIPGVALFALAEFKQERSIPVIVKSLAGQRWYVRRGSNLAAIALKQFGEKGIAAARNIPKPDPARARYSYRSRRHRGATEALTLAREVKGVENIIDGLKLPVPTDRKEYFGWLRRTQIYLQLARKYHDKRLVDPVIEILGKKPDQLWTGALGVLAEYDDPRVVPLCVKFLVKYEDYRPSEPAVNGIVKRLGKEKAAAFLVKTMAEATEPRVRAGAASALGHLSSPSSWYWGPVCKQAKEQVEAAADTWKQAAGPLIKALADRDGVVQVAAARALVVATSGGGGTIRDRSPVKPLAAWAKSAPKPSMPVIEYLACSGDPAAGEALLAAYRASGRKNRRIVSALGKLKHAQAVPDLWQALQDRLAGKDWRWGCPEIAALGQIGEDGSRKLHGVFRKPPTLAVQIMVADALCRNGYKKAFPEIQNLLEELVAAGPSNPRLQPRADSTKPRELSYLVTSLAESLVRLDARRAHPVVIWTLFSVDDQRTIDRLGWVISYMLERVNPQLKKTRILLSVKPA